MTLNLSPEYTARFVELYGREEFLYDSSHKDYRNRGMREAAIKNIAVELAVPGFGPDEVIAKFKNLRNSYSQELKRIEDSQNRYTPKVHWFPIMNSFLRPFIQTKHSLSNQKKGRSSSEGDQTSSSVKQEYDDNDDSRSSALNDIGHEYLTRSVNRWLPSSSSSSATSGQLPVQVNLNEMPSSSSTRKRKRRDEYGNNVNYLPSDSIMNAPTQPLDQNDPSVDARVSTGRKVDVYDHFGRYISSLLREIGPPDSFLLQQEVTALILDRLRESSFVKREPSNTPCLD